MDIAKLKRIFDFLEEEGEHSGCDINFGGIGPSSLPEEIRSSQSNEKGQMPPSLSLSCVNQLSNKY